MKVTLMGNPLSSAHTLALYIQHDFRTGLGGQWKKYAVALVLFCMICGRFFAEYTLAAGQPSADFENGLTLGDYMARFLCGMPLFDPDDPSFRVNILWLTIHLYLAYVIGLFPSKGLYGYGQQLLLRSRTRLTWWISKCLWTTTSTVIYYLLLFITASVFAELTGSLNLAPQSSVQSLLNDMNTEAITSTIMLKWFLIACGVSVAVSLLQMTISVLLRPLWGILSTVFLLTASIFYAADWLPGQYLMLMRCREVSGNAVHPLIGLNLSILVTTASVFIGYYAFKTRDILYER